MVDLDTKATGKPIRYRPPQVKGPSQAAYSTPIRFKNLEVKEKIKRQAEHVKRNAIVLKYNINPSTHNLNFLSDWEQILKTWEATPVERLNFLYLLKMAGISLDKADLSDRRLIMKCLQDYHKNLKDSFINSKILLDEVKANIFPLLEQATEAYFCYANPFNPLFTRAGFVSHSRSQFLKLCVWRVGLQFLPSSKLLVNLCHHIHKKIIACLIPSALSYELGTLQGLLILYLNYYEASSNKYQDYIFHCASLLGSCLGLHLVSPGPLNQERLLALFILEYNRSQIAAVSLLPWYNHFLNFPFPVSSWPHKNYPNISLLYVDHPNHRLSTFFQTDVFSATLDANIATVCLTTYHFERSKHRYKLRSDMKKSLQRVLAWGACELQKSKVIQLPNQNFVPLANCQQSHPEGMVFNYPEANAVVSQLQLVLVTRFHHILLSTSEPLHTFRLIDILKLVPKASFFFSRLDMLLDATRYLLLMPKDDRVEQYLFIVRKCLENMQENEQDEYFSSIHLRLFDAMVDRTIS